ncbi:hypothetical protein J5474_11945 [Sagittula sp. M10.9X]|uniref:Uncharacterized protein n=2 Tax=Sagittula salina TaxID=2820268 RepID=A0A940S0L0_9RHOB|nr:hypothetical protein [Sagittula salina]MBP0483198.1 hypothetical protein [Sagittula salina]
MVAAAARAFLVAILIALPAMMLPDVPSDSTQIVALLALLAALLTFVEYIAEYPSLVEFRNAPPFNRMRYVALLATVLILTLIARGTTQPTALTEALSGLGYAIGLAMDFPFSPVRLMVLVAPRDASPEALALIRTMAGLAYLISLTTMLIFVVVVRLLDWPIQKRAFNFWVNLPLFDPTTGGDILYRLKRDSHFNVALGFLLPFLAPAGLKMASSWGATPNLIEFQPLIWTMIAWSFLPASLIMRGVALMRIAALIEEKRRRAYAQADLQPA